MDLKRGSVRQLAFTSDSKQLLVLNSRAHGGFLRLAALCSRMRLFSTADWKAVADTGELEMCAPIMALSRGNTCVFVGVEYFPQGGGSRCGHYLFHTVDLPTLKLEKFEPTGMRILYPHGPVGFAFTSSKVLFAFTHYTGSPDLHPPFIFDLKTGKKTVELQEFSTRIADGMFAEFSSDGNHVLTFIDGKFRLHAADTGKLLKTMPVDSPIHAMVLSPDGKKLAAFCADGRILLVESDLSKQSNPLKVNGKRTAERKTSLAFVGNGYLAVFAERGVNADSQMEGGEIKLYDTKEWKLRHTLEKKGSWTHCISGSPDGRWLAAGFGIDGSVPGTVCIWEAASGKLVTEFK